MKYFGLILLACAFANALLAEDLANGMRTVASIKSASIKVDHFNPNDARKFELRFVLDGQYFGGPNSPIFILLGGTEEIKVSALASGQIVDLAKAHKGSLFYLEHRYYGGSYPTENLSIENLKYLTADQALEDIAEFITKLKNNPSFARSKVVLVGSGYSGALAAWARIKYANLVEIAYASSPSLLAVNDFRHYFDVASRIILSHSHDCWTAIQAGFKEMKDLMSTNEGRTILTRHMNICTQVANGEPNETHFYYRIIAQKLGLLLEKATPGVVDKKCSALLSFDGTPFTKLAHILRDDHMCLSEDYETDMEFYKEIKNSKFSSRPWLYQQCNEFGFFPTADRSNQLTGNSFSLNLFHRYCAEAFDGKFTSNIISANVNKTNQKYGGLNVKTTKLIIVNGLEDPWFPLGFVSESPNMRVLNIQGASHSQDLKSITEQDSRELRAAKQLVLNAVKKWL